LAAIIGPSVPLSAVGLSRETRSKWLEVCISKNAPDELNERRVLASTYEGALTATTTAGKVVSSYSNPAKLAEIAKAEEAAAKASAAFDRTAAGA
jgi:hypothetical protein